MKKNEKEAMVWLFGVVGVLFLLAGIFLAEITFVNGLVIAVIFWIIAGFSRRVWRVETIRHTRPAKKKARRKKR
jgi:hypothetical protein